MERHSRLRKLIRTRAWINRFLANLKQTPHSSNRNTLVTKEPQPLTRTEERAALFNIIRQSQDTSHAEIKKLLHLEKKNQLIKSLGLFVNPHDIIRCRGRLANCNDLSLEEKEPILLTQDHLGKLIVEDCHKSILHSGTRTTLLHLRTQFWIPRGRSFTKKILRNCNTCRRIDRKSYRYQDQPALPSYRINSAPPSSAVGIDYTGHLFVKSNTAEQSKAYIAVFACCITRAVHLELVTDLTEQFLL